MRYFLFLMLCLTGYNTVVAQNTKEGLLSDIKALQNLIDTKHVAPYRLVSKKLVQEKIETVFPAILLK